jgi:hypothetical protein
VREDPPSRANERLVIGAKTDTAQRGVALDRTVDVALGGGVVRLPRAVGALRLQKSGDEIVLARML